MKKAVVFEKIPAEMGFMDAKVLKEIFEAVGAIGNLFFFFFFFSPVKSLFEFNQTSYGTGKSHIGGRIGCYSAYSSSPFCPQFSATWPDCPHAKHFS